MSEITDMFHEECSERKRTARGAFNKKTHNGKGGRVKFPSDYLSEKEKRKMNGEVKTYKMNQPISWKEFKTYPDDVKITYIKTLRTRFHAPDKFIAEMMGVPKSTFGLLIQNLGIAVGKGHKPNFTDEMRIAWDNWRLQLKHTKNYDEDICMEASDEDICEEVSGETTGIQMKLDDFAKSPVEPAPLRAHDIVLNDLVYRTGGPGPMQTEKSELNDLRKENAILKAKLEMVYLIFGGDHNDD